MFVRDKKLLSLKLKRALDELGAEEPFLVKGQSKNLKF